MIRECYVLLKRLDERRTKEHLEKLDLRLKPLPNISTEDTDYLDSFRRRYCSGHKVKKEKLKKWNYENFKNHAEENRENLIIDGMTHGARQKQLKPSFKHSRGKIHERGVKEKKANLVDGFAEISKIYDGCCGNARSEEETTQAVAQVYEHEHIKDENLDFIDDIEIEVTESLNSLKEERDTLGCEKSEKLQTDEIESNENNLTEDCILLHSSHLTQSELQEDKRKPERLPEINDNEKEYSVNVKGEQNNLVGEKTESNNGLRRKQWSGDANWNHSCEGTSEKDKQEDGAFKNLSDVLAEISCLIKQLFESYKIMRHFEKCMHKSTNLAVHFKKLISVQREKFRREIFTNKEVITRGLEKIMSDRNSDGLTLEISKKTGISAKELFDLMSRCVHEAGALQGKNYIKRNNKARKLMHEAPIRGQGHQVVVSGTKTKQSSTCATGPAEQQHEGFTPDSLPKQQILSYHCTYPKAKFKNLSHPAGRSTTRAFQTIISQVQTPQHYANDSSNENNSTTLSRDMPSRSLNNCAGQQILAKLNSRLGNVPANTKLVLPRQKFSNLTFPNKALNHSISTSNESINSFYGKNSQKCGKNAGGVKAQFSKELPHNNFSGAKPPGIVRFPVGQQNTSLPKVYFVNSKYLRRVPVRGISQCAYASTLFPPGVTQNNVIEGTPQASQTFGVLPFSEIDQYLDNPVNAQNPTRPVRPLGGYVRDSRKSAQILKSSAQCVFPYSSDQVTRPPRVKNSNIHPLLLVQPPTSLTEPSVGIVQNAQFTNRCVLPNKTNQCSNGVTHNERHDFSEFSDGGAQSPTEASQLFMPLSFAQNNSTQTQNSASIAGSSQALLNTSHLPPGVKKYKYYVQLPRVSANLCKVLPQFHSQQAQNSQINAFHCVNGHVLVSNERGGKPICSNRLEELVRSKGLRENFFRNVQTPNGCVSESNAQISRDIEAPDVVRDAHFQPSGSFLNYPEISKSVERFGNSLHSPGSSSTIRTSPSGRQSTPVRTAHPPLMSEKLSRLSETVTTTNLQQQVVDRRNEKQPDTFGTGDAVTPDRSPTESSKPTSNSLPGGRRKRSHPALKGIKKRKKQRKPNRQPNVAPVPVTSQLDVESRSPSPEIVNSEPDIIILDEEELVDCTEISRSYGCAYDNCGNTGVKVCKGCLSVIYCSSACQLKHWGVKHKKECHRLRDLFKTCET